MRETSAIGRPPCTNRVAQVCLRSWNLRSVIPAILLAVAHDRLTVSVIPNTRLTGSLCGSDSISASRREVIRMERDRSVLVFIAWMLIRCLSRSTSDQRSESISPRLIPVSRAQMIIRRNFSLGPSQASSKSSSSSRESTRVRLFSSEGDMIVSLPENGCRSIHPSRWAMENILRRTVSSLLTVAMDRSLVGAFLNLTFVSRRSVLN